MNIHKFNAKPKTTLPKTIQKLRETTPPRKPTREELKEKAKKLKIRG